jgi:uncharacterized protein (TIGR03437 family)
MTKRQIMKSLLFVLLCGLVTWLAVASSAQSNETFVSVSAASFRRAPLAPESIVAGFGTRLSTATAAATTTPLPTELGGVRISVKDSANVERLAPLFFVSPQQINYQMPAGTAAGAATLRIQTASGAVLTETAQIAPVAPGLFSANADGRHAAAALALRVMTDGTQRFESVARFDPFEKRYLPLPIELMPDSAPGTTEVFLILYATGLRQRTALNNVSVRLGGVDAPVTFAGAQGNLTGLDQVNVRLPNNLIGRGKLEVALNVDGVLANPVEVSIAAPAAYFQFDIPPHPATFTIKLLDPILIQHARDLLAGRTTSEPHVIGTIVKAAAPYNRPWSYHFNPATISFFDFAIEVCDGSIQYIEDHLEEVDTDFLPGSRWCPWGSRLIKEVTPTQPQ